MAYPSARADKIIQNEVGRLSWRLPAQPGRWMVAPLRPQRVQRAAPRNLSLEASGPHRMTATAHGRDADSAHTIAIPKAWPAVVRRVLAVVQIRA